MTQFGAQLRSVRKGKGFTQQQVADHLGISVRAYQHYETGSRTPNIEKASKLARFLDVSLDELSVRDCSTESA
ncbi:helix-turn-helix domain-containing protein [Alicyclobacillus sp. ALC3]|uniref:helix-turn-helix domain-containing protein n=1 Tax=Alicyclobacillus sp. ALC3 TaxID=2796143 RepID=UPI0023798FE3|nr:helix-turn-helix transcriptional regulator [Alicyclobacillus sp. ALC3]WDL96376.1 helix-turn-helix transcriptional regulator [Alicyclobacillus sp. ALC3]